MDELIQIFSSITKSGGFTLWLLGLCSVIFLAAAGERTWFFLSKRTDSEGLSRELAKDLEDGRDAEALEKCSLNDTVFHSAAECIIKRRGMVKDDIESAAAAAIEGGILRYENHIQTLGTLAVIAPFIGLMGTVIGIMTAFSDIAQAGAAGPQTVAKGVSEALAATAAGLMLAIPASVLFNVFKSEIKKIRTRAGVFCSRLIEAVCVKRGASKEKES